MYRIGESWGVFVLSATYKEFLHMYFVTTSDEIYRKNHRINSELDTFMETPEIRIQSSGNEGMEGDREKLEECQQKSK